MTESTASKEIDNIIKTYNGWKGELLARLRAVIKQAGPDVVEEIKWKMPTRPDGLPVWSCKGMLCFAEIWKDNIKLIFPKGVHLKDPNKLFNSRLQSKDIRAIEFKDSSQVDEASLRELVLEALMLNKSKAK